MTRTDTAASTGAAGALAPREGVANADAGAVAVVHPRLSAVAAEAMRSAGFARLAATDRLELWVRYPAD